MAELTGNVRSEGRPRFCARLGWRHCVSTDSGGHTVIWFYAKHGRHLRCEVRQHVDGDRFDLVITDADGTERVEHFEDSASVTRRSQQLEAEWLIEGWDGPFGREY